MSEFLRSFFSHDQLPYSAPAVHRLRPEDVYKRQEIMSVDIGGKPHVTRSAFSFTGSPIPTPNFAVISTIPTQSCEDVYKRQLVKYVGFKYSCRCFGYSSNAAPV